MFPVIDYGGDGPDLHLAHANGFPPGTYRLLVDILTEHYRVFCLPSRPLWPHSRTQSAPCWRVMAKDLIQGLDDIESSRVFGIGHSMGGDLTLWAAVSRPDLFRRVVLIDPVILPSAWLWMVRVFRSLGMQRRLPMVQGALRRRSVWPSRQACYDHYRGKQFFARWSDASLRAYVEAGTRELVEGGVTLAYSPEWEAHVFATVPVDIWRAVSKLRIPVLVIRGERSNTFVRESQVRMERLLPQARYVVIPDAGHLAPMERPEAVGEAILDFLRQGTV
jgi:pimeloyl-ACP methyl ester carboxylesterase